MDFSGVSWRKSTRSGNGGEACVEVGAWRISLRSGSGGEACVEVGECTCGGTAVRDSKDPQGPKLTFTTTAWATFHHDVLTGRYDL